MAACGENVLANSCSPDIFAGEQEFASTFSPKGCMMSRIFKREKRNFDDDVIRGKNATSVVQA